MGALAARHEGCLIAGLEEVDMPQQSQSQTQQSQDSELQNEGEGSRTGARRYDEKAQKAASDPAQVEKLAREAEKALEGPEGDELRRADERGKKAQHN